MFIHLRHLTLPLIDREITQDELKRLSLLFGVFTDGSGQLRVDDYGTLPGWRDFERIFEAFYDGRSTESKHPFDIIALSGESRVGLSVKSKAVTTQNAFCNLQNEQLHIELSNSSAIFWSALKSVNLTEKEFGDDAFATAFGKCITQTSGAISSPKNLNELDENLSCHLVISYLKPKDDRPPLYQIFSCHYFSPKIK